MRDFLKTVLATFLGLVLFTTLGIAGLAALLVAIASATSQEPESTVADNSVLSFDLSQTISDAPPSSGPSEIIGQAISGDETPNPVALRSVLEAIEQAATDDRIVGLYIHNNVDAAAGGSGFATLREVRQALEKFRESGKPIYAYDREGWQERDYYLASVADHVMQHPSGILEFNGISAENIFFARALQKYGIGIQILRVGKYKSAVEPFIRNESSPEEEEQTRKLLTDLWNEFLTTSANSRNLTPQKLQAIADQKAVLLPNEAEAAGLIDKIAYEDEVTTELEALTGKDEETHSFRQITVSEYADAIELENDKSSENRVAIVYAEGEIVNGFGTSRSIGGESLVETLREVRQDDNIKAVVLRVNSPGGSASASEQIAREVQLTTKTKPVIVSMGSYAASGGYQISTYANRIFASPTTITGSIGVFGLLPNFKKIANDNGITWDGVKTGRYADFETVSRPKTPEELAIAQRLVDRIYDNFLTIVSQSRDLPKDKVATIAQGRVWSGVEAQKLGLVDDLGGLEEAIQAAAEEAKLGDDWQIEEYPKSDSFWFAEIFNTRQAKSAAPSDPISLELQQLKSDLGVLQSMNDPRGVYMRLPFNPRID